MNLTGKFADSLASEVQKPDPRIQAIFEAKMCKSEAEERTLVHWLTQLYNRKFNEKIGFTEATLPLWPALYETRIIMKKVEFLAPGMTQSIDSNGSIQNRPIIQRLAKKFENDKISRKAELKIKPGTHNLKISILPC